MKNPFDKDSPNWARWARQFGAKPKAPEPASVHETAAEASARRREEHAALIAISSPFAQFADAMKKLAGDRGAATASNPASSQADSRSREERERAERAEWAAFGEFIQAHVNPQSSPFYAVGEALKRHWAAEAAATSAKASADKILAAAKLRDTGGTILPMPEPGSTAAAILAAGRRRRNEGEKPL